MSEDKKLRERYLRLDCAALCDASPLTKALLPGLTPLNPELKMVGKIYPITCSNDYLSVIKAVEEAADGDVLVIDGRGQTQAVFGELLAAEAKRRGLSGAIVDGSVRDLKGMKEIGFPVYYRYSNPRAGRADIVELPTESVCVCGAVVKKGDWIMGDGDGLVVIPASHASEIVAVAEEIQGVEDKVFANVKKGEALSKIMHFEEFRREHDREIRSKLEFHLSREK